MSDTHETHVGTAAETFGRPTPPVSVVNPPEPTPAPPHPPEDDDLLDAPAESLPPTHGAGSTGEAHSLDVEAPEKRPDAFLNANQITGLEAWIGAIIDARIEARLGSGAGAQQRLVQARKQFEGNFVQLPPHD